MKLSFVFISIIFQAVVIAQPVKFPALPDKVFKQLFIDVQSSKIFEDSKTFVDCVPKRDPSEILKDYAKAKKTLGFSLKQFVGDNFSLPQNPPVLNYVQKEKNVISHIKNLWKVLYRKPDEKVNYSSLLPLPNPYIVPGGRFREMYYWDSYFTMLGLLENGDTTSVENMINNFAYLINTYGHIPNGNRSYYLSRSQPPFFGLMIELLAHAKKDDKIYGTYEKSLQKEYDYWMNGAKYDLASEGYKRVVRLQDGTVLNRYWDDDPTPRPESYVEDVVTAELQLKSIDSGTKKSLSKQFKLQSEKYNIYYNLKAGAESGWDFSSRWFKDTFNLVTIQTTNYIPVDLNCLLFSLEQTLIKAIKINRGTKARIDMITIQSEKRKEAINKYCWDVTKAFYVDWNFKTQQPSIISAAGMVPFFIQIAPKERVQTVVKTLQTTLLKAGGIVSTPFKTGQQWDLPNGWAPQQWMAIKGLENYVETTLAKDIAKRWMELNIRVYNNTGRLMEKYNVVDMNLQAGGGEYPTQDGFGWTNGVLLALIKQYGLPSTN